MIKDKKFYKFKLGASTFLVDIENGAKLLAWDISIAGVKLNVLKAAVGDFVSSVARCTIIIV